MNEQKNILVEGNNYISVLTAILLSTKVSPNYSITLFVNNDKKTSVEVLPPTVKEIFSQLSIEESDWMSKVGASYHLGTKITDEKYIDKQPAFIPYYSDVDYLFYTNFYQRAELRAQGYNVESHPKHFFFNAMMEKGGLSPVQKRHFPFKCTYGYQCDITKLKAYLLSLIIDRKLNIKVVYNQALHLSTQQEQLFCRYETSIIPIDLFIGTSKNAIKYKGVSENLLNIPYSKILQVEVKNNSCNLANNYEVTENGLIHSYFSNSKLTIEYIYNELNISNEHAIQFFKEYLQHNHIKTIEQQYKMIETKGYYVKKPWHNNILLTADAFANVGNVGGVNTELAIHSVFQMSKLMEHYNGENENELSDRYNKTVLSALSELYDYQFAIHKLLLKNSKSTKQIENIQPSSLYLTVMSEWQKHKVIRFNQLIMADDATTKQIEVRWYSILAASLYYEESKNQFNQPIDIGEVSEIHDFLHACLKNYETDFIPALYE